MEGRTCNTALFRYKVSIVNLRSKIRTSNPFISWTSCLPKESPHLHALLSLIGRLLVSLPFGPGHLGYDRRHGAGDAEAEGAGVRGLG